MNEPQPKKDRIEEVTLLRALAFLAITMQHCIAEYIYRPDIEQPDSIMLAMLFHFTRFGTPTFVLLAGIILFYNNTSDSLRYGHFLRRRFVDIVVPFLSWTIIYFFVVRWLSGQSLSLFYSEGWSTLGQQLLTPTYGYHLWFILMIVQFYVLLPLWLRVVEPLKRFVQRKPERAVVRTLLLISAAGLLYTALLWYSYYEAAAEAGGGGVWAWLLTHRSRWFVAYFFYFVLGAVCAYGLNKVRELTVSGLVLGGLLFIGCYTWAGYELLSLSMEHMLLGLSTYLRPTIFVLILVQLFAAYGLCVLLHRYGGWFKRFLLFVGRHSFGGFLAHALVLTFVAQATRPMALAGHHLIAAIITFVVVAAGSIGLAKGIAMLPVGHLIIGAQGRRERKRRTPSAAPTIQAGGSVSSEI